MAGSPDVDGLAAALGRGLRRREPLKSYTALRVGGPADLLIVCQSVDDVVRVVGLARRHGVRWWLLGSGCNVLVSEAGVRGLVIVNRAAVIDFEDERRPEPVEVLVQADAGAPLAALAREAVKRGLAGLEWAAGLPGTVGGAVVGNAGAFGGDVASALRSATVLEPNGELLKRSADWFEFEYRGSRLKDAEDESCGEYVVLGATFGLRPGDPEALATRMEQNLEWRRAHHPAGATMGSTFKNPPGEHAGRLIARAGLRGYRIGGAQVSETHGNFFVNTGGATARDVRALIEHTQRQVERQFGVELELEIELVGEWGSGQRRGRGWREGSASA